MPDKGDWMRIYIYLKFKNQKENQTNQQKNKQYKGEIEGERKRLINKDMTLCASLS